MKKGVRDQEGPLFTRFKRWYMRVLDRCLARPRATHGGVREWRWRCRR